MTPEDVAGVRGAGAAARRGRPRRGGAAAGASRVPGPARRRTRWRHCRRSSNARRRSCRRRPRPATSSATCSTSGSSCSTAEGFTRQPERLRRPAQQLPERRARAPHGHPDHAVDHLHARRATGRPVARGRQLSRPFPRALQGHARRRRADRGPDPRPLPRRHRAHASAIARGSSRATPATARASTARCSRPRSRRRSWCACSST